MRELKFRTFFQGKMYFWGIGVDGAEFVSPISGAGETAKTLHQMQFTSLYDKNGKEIYEGDICQDEEGFGVIYWDKDCWRYGFVLFDSSYSSDGEMLREMTNWCEVIGNIYENPELLEAK